MEFSRGGLVVIIRKIKSLHWSERTARRDFYGTSMFPGFGHTTVSYLCKDGETFGTIRLGEWSEQLCCLLVSSKVRLSVGLAGIQKDPQTQMAFRGVSFEIPEVGIVAVW